MADSCFEALYVPEPNTGCWLWCGNRNKAGYGLVKRRPKVWLAHRLSWLLHRGGLCDQDKVLHRCDTPECVNPDHLFLGTQADNIRDMEAKGRARHPCRAAHGRSKLSENDVAAIREEYAVGGIRQADLAARYGVNQTTVSDIVRRVHWR